MRVVKTIEAFYQARKTLQGSVGFVPTMGALHEGHLSLMRRAREENDHVVVSIFVNPTQFLEGEDLDAYPRRDEEDSRICELAKVDLLFMPTIEQIYTSDELRIGAPAIRGYVLEGAKRPGHFDGMLQIVMKLLNLTRATRAYFGKKDAQQLALIMQMVHNYFMSVEIVACEIVRDSLGLALSSRNLYLTTEERQRALCLSRSLKKATEMVMASRLDTVEIRSEMLGVLHEVDRVEYVAVVNRTFEQIDKVVLDDTIILVAAWVGKPCLIDNIWI